MRNMIKVEKLIVKNFKCFEHFEIDFNDNVNIIVGNNEEGKTTILEALHLALSGMMNGRYLNNEISENVFNKSAVTRYLDSLGTEEKLPMPEILIEVFLKGEGTDFFEGDSNTSRVPKRGLGFKVCFNESYQDEYQAFIQQKDIKSLPVEYYKIERFTFGRAPITNKSIPLKSVIIDSSTNYQNGSDVYISKIIKDNLDEKELTALTQSYRMLKESFGQEAAVKSVNEKVALNAGISEKEVRVSVDMSVRNTWETILMTYVDDVPFHQIGKGEQCIIKTNLALAHNQAITSNLILIEEPENHLSHVNLNVLLKSISEKCADKQLIITTHSNYVANKLNLNNLILLANKKALSFKDLPQDDADYFQKLPGYDTLRLILSDASILVEGPSDELIVQRAFQDKHGVLPIEKGIDVISVRGLSFKRFLEISRKTKKKVAVVTDNDGDYDKKITQKYRDYFDITWIKICASENNDLDTLEPQFVDANKEHLDDIRNVLGINEESYPNTDTIQKYMRNCKTDWALGVFCSESNFNYPDYINKAVDWIVDDDGE